jgi:hypothetical protein
LEKIVGATILFVGNDRYSDDKFKAELERCGHIVDYVSCEQELITRIIKKGGKIDLIIISDLCDKDKKVLSENIFSNINIPVVHFQKSIDKDLFFSDINKNIDYILGLNKKQLATNALPEQDDLLEAFALHEIICDSNGKAVDYRFLDADKKFLKRVQKTKEEIIGKTALELFPNTEQIWIETFGRVALSGNSEVIMHYSAEFDNYYEARIYSPEKGQFIAVFIDITKTKGKYVCK